MRVTHRREHLSQMLANDNYHSTGSTSIRTRPVHRGSVEEMQSSAQNCLSFHACSRPCERRRDRRGFPLIMSTARAEMTRSNIASIRSDTLATQNTSCGSYPQTPGGTPCKHVFILPSQLAESCRYGGRRRVAWPLIHKRVYPCRLGLTYATCQVLVSSCGFRVCIAAATCVCCW